ncbi:MAG TPA: PepSY-like domain-containing protein [Paludibacteraceae bacterium]|jgi:hypothetical protein|nr:PepSY-like domain-containing protein [Paludibacteraceae bacterium]HQB68908.1 PepSY-like domain-containing protein [Paludibacteraceae bacterium]HRS67216.1 PepSY-like domain-containing protein [Paludibacteraceae bacterium]
MKKQNVFKTVFIALTLMISLASCANEEVIPAAKLPAEVQTYISTHFPTHTILQAVVDIDGFTKTYDILLSDRVKLEFNRKGQVIDIDSETALPDSVIPEKIRQYVAANYPASVIVGWELEDRHQQVKLNNGLDLEFTMSGDFLRIDA